MVVRSSVINRLQEARDRGVEYLLQHQRDDGAIGSPETEGIGPIYKAMWALAAGGHAEAGNRLANWVVKNLMTDEGDFAGELRGKDHDYSYSYANAWIVCGAHRLGRYDISRRGMEFLLVLQHAEEGGFRTQRDNEDGPQDLLCSSQAGNACLATGHLPEARSVARFLRNVWDAQPHPERELFFMYKPGEGLRSEFPQERQRLYSIRIDTNRQRYFNIGIAAAFLSRMTLTTGDREWVELGKRYLEIGFNVLDEMYETAQVGKVGWGAALVYGVSGEQRYLELAQRVGEAMIAQQTDSGGWDNTGGFVNDAIRHEVTAEFVVLLDEMVGGIAAQD